MSLKRKQYIESFLYLYRLIEKVSIAFPLIYIMASEDFIRAHGELSAIFKKDGSEIDFSTRFAQRVAGDSDYLSNYKIVFNTSLDTVEQFEVLLREMRRCCSLSMENCEEVDVDEGFMSMQFINIPKLIIDVRNRLFHNSNTGQSNFNIDEIGGASELCRMVTYGGLHWFALAFGEVVKRRMRRL